MKTLTAILLALAAFLMCSSPPRAQAPAPPAPAQATPQSMADAAYADIKAALGFVPTFMRSVPPEAIGAAWEEMRTIELAPETALSNRLKELIGLAVAAQVPCRYCVYAHSEFAKANGATERELAEAVAMAAITRHWSTVLNGMAVDSAAFDKDMAKVFAYLGKAKGKPQPAAAADPITDANSAMKDIERTLGSVPGFFSAFPARGLPAAWREMKNLQLNPATALDGKAKELIGLAVAAQVPCTYCIRFHTSAAKLHGASQQEIQEAVAMAAVTRHWSTILQGTQQDEPQFRRDIDQIVRRAKPKTPKAAKR